MPSDDVMARYDLTDAHLVRAGLSVRLCQIIQPYQSIDMPLACEPREGRCASFFVLRKLKYRCISMVMTYTSSSKDVPTNPAIRRAWIIFQLRIRGLSLGILAHQEGVSRQAMSHALIGPSSHLQPAIAKAIELPVQDVWPEWWRPDGTPWGRTNVRHRNTQRRPRNVQNDTAA